MEMAPTKHITLYSAKVCGTSIERTKIDDDMFRDVPLLIWYATDTYCYPLWY